MSTTQQQSTEESTLEDEAFRISEATNDDGTVDVEIKNVDKNDDSVTVEFETPWLEQESETMPWPKVDDSTYKIVRICEDTIGSFTGVTQLEGTKVPANPDTWEIAIEPDEKVDIKETAKNYALKGGEIAGVLGFLGSIGMVAGLFLLLVAFPFGVSVVGLWQGFALLLVAIVTFFVSIGILDLLNEDN